MLAKFSMKVGPAPIEGEDSKSPLGCHRPDVAASRGLDLAFMSNPGSRPGFHQPPWK
jgi:hypothetical protein